MTQDEALQIFRDTGALLEGHFLLRSGLHSRQFFQCAIALQQMPTVERSGAALAGLVRALDVQTRWRFGFYDSLIVAGALTAGCSRLLSEDLQHGQRVESLTAIGDDWQLTTSRGTTIIARAVIAHLNLPPARAVEGLQPRAITRDIEWGVPIPVPGYEDKVQGLWLSIAAQLEAQGIDPRRIASAVWLSSRYRWIGQPRGRSFTRSRSSTARLSLILSRCFTRPRSELPR